MTALPSGVQARPARVEDADAIVELLMRGFETYSSWAPEWSLGEELRRAQLEAWRAGLAQPEAWTSLAESGRSPVAVARFAPARVGAGVPDLVPGMAHLGALFVDPAWWGRGVGRAMLGAATEEMTARGFESARVLAPDGNRRALDIYARHGFEPIGPWSEELFGLRVIEHRLRLGAAGQRGPRR